MMRKQWFKDLTRALSLANLLFLPVWSVLLDYSSNWESKFLTYNPARFLAVMLNVTLLGLLLWGAVSFVRWSKSVSMLAVARWGALAALIIPPVTLFDPASLYARLGMGRFNLMELIGAGALIVLPGVRLIAPAHRIAAAVGALACLLVLGRTEMALLWLVPSILIALVLWRWHRSILRVVPVILAIFFPFFLLTFLQTVRFLTLFADKPPAPAFETEQGDRTRVLWMVFDELDQRMAISERPDSLSLPELDRFRSHALTATRAFPPSGYTLSSLPALITGRLVKRAEPLHPSELLLTFEDTAAQVRWGRQPNVFSQARELGVNTAVVGWYHPYSRIIGSDLTRSFWHDLEDAPLSRMMSEQIGVVTELSSLKSPSTIQGEKLDHQHRKRVNSLRAYVRILDEAKKAAADSKLRLVLVHWPVPHPPGIYSRAKREYDLTGESSYLDSLALVDRTLGEIRSVMEQAGTWDETVVIVTSDHWWRTSLWKQHYVWTGEDAPFTDDSDHRIPFVLKLSKQTRPFEYHNEFNTVLTKELILAILRGEVATPEAAAGWLDRNGTVGETHYVFETN